MKKSAVVIFCDATLGDEWVEGIRKEYGPSCKHNTFPTSWQVISRNHDEGICCALINELHASDAATRKSLTPFVVPVSIALWQTLTTQSQDVSSCAFCRFLILHREASR